MVWPEVTPRVVLGPLFDTDDENIMGERPDLDPFDDDTPLECGIEDPEVCDSCQ
jgi:hypothetical protein